MKKYRFLLTFAAVVSAAESFSCGKKVSNADAPSDAAIERVAPENIAFNWQEPYKNKLEEFKKSSDFSIDASRFDLSDLDADGTPELIISPSSDSDSACSVYSCVDGKTTLIGENGDFGRFDYYPETCVFNNEHSGDGFVLGEFRSISEGGFKTVSSYYNNAGSAASGAVIVYEVDKTEVTLKEYEDYIATYSGAPSITLGRKYSFGDASIKCALYRSESWGAVLTEKEKELFKNKLNELVPSYNEFAGFELCDLDGDAVPELVFSEGVSQDSSCLVFKLSEEGLAQVGDKYASAGIIGFDPNSNVFFNLDPSISNSAWSLSESGATGYQRSGDWFECGRKYIVSEDAINRVLS